MTSNGQNGGNGGRVPGVWFWSASSPTAKRNRFHICASVNGVGNFCYNSAVTIPLDQWTSVEISQRPEGASYRYEVKINGKRLGSSINNKARTWPNVKVYVADKWYPAAPGSMRNLVIATKGESFHDLN